MKDALQSLMGDPAAAGQLSQAVRKGVSQALMKEPMKNAERLRALWKIPLTYGRPVVYAGKLCFSFCGHDIDVYPDGTAKETWMGLGARAESHVFHERSWEPT